MTNTEISVKHIEQFDGTNFQEWKFQLKNLFLAYDIYDIVSGTKAKLSPNNSASFKAWIKDDAKVQCKASHCTVPACPSLKRGLYSSKKSFSNSTAAF